MVVCWEHNKAATNKYTFTRTQMHAHTQILFNFGQNENRKNECLRTVAQLAMKTSRKTHFRPVEKNAHFFRSNHRILACLDALRSLFLFVCVECGAHTHQHLSDCLAPKSIMKWILDGDKKTIKNGTHSQHKTMRGETKPPRIKWKDNWNRYDTLFLLFFSTLFLQTKLIKKMNKIIFVWTKWKKYKKKKKTKKSKREKWWKIHLKSKKASRRSENVQIHLALDQSPIFFTNEKKSTNVCVSEWIYFKLIYLKLGHG